MTEIEMEPLPDERRGLHLEWLLPLFFRPRRTLTDVLACAGRAWLAPLLALSLLAVLQIVCTGSLRQAASGGAQVAPENAQFYTPEQMQQFKQASANAGGALFIYVLPTLGALLGVWLGWFLLGSLLHLALTLSGSRGTSAAAFNLAGWASLPLALRFIVQTIGALSAGHPIQRSGLSGFVAADAGGGLLYLGAVLALVDLYWLWQVALLLLGSTRLSNLPRGKAWAATLLAAVLLLLLQALPAFVGAQLSGLSTGGGFMPF